VAFWQNPEFIRHMRAEMRAPRAITMAVLTLVICALVALSCWGASSNPREFFRLLHYWVVGIQFAVLGLWCASACGHAISRERELKTFDFLRTTRLTAAELVVGKVLGAPIMAYFVVGCSLPISLGAGILGGISLRALFGVLILLIVFALLVSIVGLWVSMQLEKSNSGLPLIVTVAPIAFGYSFSFTPFSGFGAISIFPPLFALYDVQTNGSVYPPTVAGFPLPFLALTLILYAAFGAWFVLMLVRNLKKEREETHLLTGWQSIGFLAFLNVLFYAFLDPKRLMEKYVNGAYGPPNAAMTAMLLNSAILFLLGITLIGSREKLKIWWRNWTTGHMVYLSTDGLVWPWPAIGAVVAYAFLAAEAFGMQRAIPLASWKLGMSAVIFLDFLVFIVRDVVFLQWCTLTRMKRPLLKGFLYLGLYYFAAGIVSSVISLASKAFGGLLIGLLTPWQMMGLEEVTFVSAHASYVGIALQVAVTFFMVTAITRRLSRPPLVPAPSPA
jgi:hypothetical protein